jgi:hypothetical protein
MTMTAALGTKAAHLRRIALDYLHEKHEAGEIPTSIRFLFYEVEQRGLVSKEKREIKPGCRTARTHSQDFTDAITQLRERGAIPWSWIVDDGRSADDWSASFTTVMAAVEDYAETARINPWVGEAVKLPVLITESRGVAGVLSRRTAYTYRVPVAGLGGQCRGFLETEVADLLRDPNTRVLYIGDADDCGDDIEANTRRVLERATGRTFGPDTWERLAITPQQVAELRRRGVQPILKRDRRYTDGNPHEAFEAEALGQSEIERIVRDRLDQLLPEPIETVQVRERRQREAVCAALEQIAEEQAP